MVSKAGSLILIWLVAVSFGFGARPTKEPTRVQGAFIGVVVRDVEAGLRWYETNFDVHLLKRGMGPSGHAGNAVLAGGGLYIELMFFQNSTAKRPEEMQDGSLPPGITKAGAVVSRAFFDRTWHRLHKNGAQFRGGLFDDKEMGMRTFIVVDYEGNMIQLFSPLRESKQR